MEANVLTCHVRRWMCQHLYCFKRGSNAL